ncbi:MAG: hypothetical protein ACRERX_14035, partial [Pseudomonas sp.]
THAMGELPMVRGKESDTLLSAPILLRVAEAADGLRDGKPHWFLVSRRAPHSVKPFDSARAAERALVKAGRRKFMVLGPYLTRPKDGPKNGRTKPKKKIRSVEIYIEGVRKPVKLDPAKVDAIFLSQSALDKFAYPYYTRVHGPGEAARLRRTQLSSEDPFVGHTPWTQWDDEGEEEEDNGDD